MVGVRVGNLGGGLKGVRVRVSGVLGVREGQQRGVHLDAMPS